MSRAMCVRVVVVVRWGQALSKSTQVRVVVEMVGGGKG